jgi:hypothetical protein
LWTAVHVHNNSGQNTARAAYPTCVKLMTRTQAETKRRQAIKFLQRIGRDDDAARFETSEIADLAEEALDSELTREEWRQERKNSLELSAETPDESNCGILCALAVCRLIGKQGFQH